MATCESCGTANADGVAYCKSCGKKLERRESTVICPSCSEKNPTDVAYCWNCGGDLVRAPPSMPKPDEVALRPAPVGKPSAEKKRCPWCDHSIDYDTLVCPWCGRDLRRSWPITSLGARRRGSDWVVLAGIMVFISGLVAFLSAYQIFQAEGQIENELGFHLGSIACCGSLEIIFGIGAMIGGFIAMTKRSFVLSVIGSVLGMFSMGPFLVGSGVAFFGFLIIVLNRSDFDS